MGAYKIPPLGVLYTIRGMVPLRMAIMTIIVNRILFNLRTFCNETCLTTINIRLIPINESPATLHSTPICRIAAWYWQKGCSAGYLTAKLHYVLVNSSFLFIRLYHKHFLYFSTYPLLPSFISSYSIILINDVQSRSLSDTTHKLAVCIKIHNTSYRCTKSWRCMITLFIHSAD
jgi:hypothetical protein